MVNPERREPRRFTLQELAYINFEPNNGGIVLNISEGGLCYRVVNPVVDKGKLRFSFSLNGSRIDGDGDIIWTDETQKTGGLQFSAPSIAVREQLRTWTGQSVKPPFKSGGELAAVLPPTGKLAQKIEAPADSNPAEALPSEKRPIVLLGGFSGGLATGILICAFIAAVVFVHSYAGHLGEFLVQLGQRLEGLEARPAMPPVTSAPAGLSTSQVNPQQHTAALMHTTPIPVVQPEKPPSPSGKEALEPKSADLAPAQTSPTPPMVSLPMTRQLSGSILTLPEPTDFAQPEAANNSGRDTRDLVPSYTSSAAGKYFEVGKFRDAFLGNRAVDTLEQLGFHAMTVHTHTLWVNSYHVLVGPYGNQIEMAKARQGLESLGFRARALPSKSMHYKLPPEMTLYGTDVTLSDCIITWEVNSPDATVKFMRDTNVVATAKGTWEKSNFTLKDDAIVWQPNERGPRTLLGIQFRKLDQELVLGGSDVRFYRP